MSINKQIQILTNFIIQTEQHTDIPNIENQVRLLKKALSTLQNFSTDRSILRSTLLVMKNTVEIINRHIPQIPPDVRANIEPIEQQQQIPEQEDDQPIELTNLTVDQMIERYRDECKGIKNSRDTSITDREIRESYDKEIKRSDDKSDGRSDGRIGGGYGGRGGYTKKCNERGEGGAESLNFLSTDQNITKSTDQNSTDNSKQQTPSQKYIEKNSDTLLHSIPDDDKVDLQSILERFKECRNESKKVDE